MTLKKELKKLFKKYNNNKLFNIYFIDFDGFCENMLFYNKNKNEAKKEFKKYCKKRKILPMYYVVKKIEEA